jgi:pimeloyl-ACP methyl ester carboxylesterase
MPYAKNGPIRIYYQTEGAGPPLVLHHWSLATLENWDDYGYVTALKNDYRVIRLDARGHGRSDKPHESEAYGLQARVEDVIAVFDDLGIAQAHFFGYSMGGWIGFGMARYAPDRLRSLIIGGQHPYAQSMDGLRQVVRYAIEHGPEAFVALWEEDADMSPESKRRMLTYDYEALLAVAQDRESLEAVLPTMDIPCLLIVGEQDTVYPAAEKCSHQIPGVTFVALPGLDHGATILRSDLLLPHLRRFLETVDR